MEAKLIDLLELDRNQLNKAEAVEKPELTGIAGWLVFPAIGLIIAPFTLLQRVFDDLGYYSLILPEGGSKFIYIIIVLQIFLFVYLIVLIQRFFRTKKNAPKLMIGFLLANIFVNFTVSLIGASQDMILYDEYFNLGIMSLIAGAIWIPYYLKSKRVKNTFIK